MPVIGSSRVLNCEIVQAGEMRRSEDEFTEVMSMGISAAVSKDIFGLRNVLLTPHRYFNLVIKEDFARLGWLVKIWAKDSRVLWIKKMPRRLECPLFRSNPFHTI